MNWADEVEREMEEKEKVVLDYRGTKFCEDGEGCEYGMGCHYAHRGEMKRCYRYVMGKECKEGCIFYHGSYEEWKKKMRGEEKKKVVEKEVEKKKVKELEEKVNKLETEVEILKKLIMMKNN